MAKEYRIRVTSKNGKRSLHPSVFTSRIEAIENAKKWNIAQPDYVHEVVTKYKVIYIGEDGKRHFRTLLASSADEASIMVCYKECREIAHIVMAMQVE